MLDTPLIRDVMPGKATYRPGEAATITVTVDNNSGKALRGLLVLELLHLADAVGKLEQSVELEANSTGDFIFSMTPPGTPLRGYGLDATLYGRDGEALGQASGALDVLERWSQAPRYGFLSDFGPDQVAGMEARCRSLVRYHLNVVQFYDWMWRHYRLLPPEEEFTDALGRNLSLRTVRAGIRGVQTGGGAAMAYGAVYGAEPEYADRHTELRLYDEAGVPISLAELFYIMNIAPDSPWVDLMVAEFAEAVRELGFDGIHLDQYGFPKTAYTAVGKLVDLSLHFPALIDRARAAVVAERAGAGVIFNAVENWPIETVAATSQDAVYIEVWPPYVTYNDLRELIREGKRLGKDKQVILAAYLSPFLDASGETMAGAEAAALLATAAISASGGFHLLLGEQDGVLCDPYYPKYATMRPDFATRMRAYYDFLVRYEELFIAPDVEDWQVALGWEAGDDRSIEITSMPGMQLSGEAVPGTMWVITRSKPGYRIAHLINLSNQDDVLWNAPHSTTEPVGSFELRIEDLPPVKEVLFLTPERQRASALEWTQRERCVQIQLPNCDVWAVVVCVLA
jgi:dextranase